MISNSIISYYLALNKKIEYINILIHIYIFIHSFIMSCWPADLTLCELTNILKKSTNTNPQTFEYFMINRWITLTCNEYCIKADNVLMFFDIPLYKQTYLTIDDIIIRAIGNTPLNSCCSNIQQIINVLTNRKKSMEYY